MRLPVVDDLQWLAMTVMMEAEGEPYEGKLGVAFTICTRADTRKRSIPDMCLERAQYSAWNQDSPTRARLDTIDPQSASWFECYKAACAALFCLEEDPTKGAGNYLNEAATRAGRPDGSLPQWFDATKVTARVGKHTFLKL